MQRARGCKGGQAEGTQGKMLSARRGAGPAFALYGRHRAGTGVAGPLRRSLSDGGEPRRVVAIGPPIAEVDTKRSQLRILKSRAFIEPC